MQKPWGFFNMAEEETKKEPVQAKEKIAVIRIRGETGIKKPIKDTLTMLNLGRKNVCAIVPKTKDYLGMLHKVKDYVTYGDVDEATIKELQEKRGKENRKTFTLNPPRGGFERKGTKKSYTQKGALGYRGEKIKELIKKMI